LYILTPFITQFSLGYLDKGSLYCCLPFTSNTSIRKILCSSDLCTHALKAILPQIPLEFQQKFLLNLTAWNFSNFKKHWNGNFIYSETSKSAELLYAQSNAAIYRIFL
jgi:hypothetical protein